MLEEQPAVLGPRQLSPVCCLGCCLPLRYADITWFVFRLFCFFVCLFAVLDAVFPSDMLTSPGMLVCKEFFAELIKVMEIHFYSILLVLSDVSIMLILGPYDMQLV